MSEKAVIYARVSSEVQGDGYSLQTQLASCRQHAHAHDYHVVGEYIDHQSGEVLERQQLGRLLEQLCAESVPVVVVHSLDRFTRDRGHLALLELELARAGARAEFVIGHYGDSAEGQLSKEIEIAIAYYENRQRVERTQRGRRGRIAAGRVRQFGSRAPYGYSFERDLREFVVREDEAGIVRWMYDQIVAGVGCHTVAASLTAAGHATASGKRTWQASAVYYMMRNPLYRGIWTEHVQGVAYTVEVPAIVGEGLWTAAQQRLDASRPRPTTRSYLLNGLLKCTCGKAWTGYAKGPAQAYYRCNSIYGRAAREACAQAGRIGADLLEEAIWAAVVALLQRPAWLENAREQRQQQVQAACALQDTRIHEVTAELVQLDRRSSALLDALLDGQMSPEAVARQTAELAEQRTRLAADLARVQESAQPPVPKVDQASLAQFVDMGLAVLDFSQRRQLLKLLRVQLVVERQDCIHMTVLDGLVTQTVAVDLPDGLSAPRQLTPYRPRKEIDL